MTPTKKFKTNPKITTTSQIPGTPRQWNGKY